MVGDTYTSGVRIVFGTLLVLFVVVVSIAAADGPAPVPDPVPVPAEPRPAAADNLGSVFHIERNKNRNEVHYGIRLDSTCRPDGADPVYNYWRRLEDGPDVTKPVTLIQQVAYGFREQTVTAETTRVVLRALPERAVTVSAARDDDGCTARAYIEIDGARARFLRAYVFAVEGLLRPAVQYIDLFGVRDDGSPVRERVGVD